MTEKQVLRSVLEGRQVVFHTFVGSIVGYLCGMDDYHWMLVTPQGVKRVIHKGSAPVFDLTDDSTYADEPNHAVLEEVVAPFRAYAERMFSRESSARKQGVHT